MKMIYKAFAKKLFGKDYERLIRTLLVLGAVFFGLRTAGMQIEISAGILYLMASMFTAGIMWQALSSKDQASYLQNLYMLPFENRKLVFSYISALGSYTLLTKTAALLSVAFAVSAWTWTEVLGSFLCAVHAALFAAVLFSFRNHPWAGSLWAVVVVIVLLWGENMAVFWILAIHSLFLLLVLWRADAYSFYFVDGKRSRTVKSRRHVLISAYFVRYLRGHKNYLANTGILWGLALVLPVFFEKTADTFALPMGFALLTFNTPVCILLSGDPALERAVRFLPGQGKGFCIPYGLFLFFCNFAADVIFLCSWQIQSGGVTARMAGMAAVFSSLGAVLSVMLEWFFPVRGWKIESDLWHHPRKYVVPGIMLMLAGGISHFTK